jgi:hypothetical protein
MVSTFPGANLQGILVPMTMKALTLPTPITEYLPKVLKKAPRMVITTLPRAEVPRGVVAIS